MSSWPWLKKPLKSRSGFYSYSNDLSYARIRRRAIKNLMVLFIGIFGIVGLVMLFMDAADEVREKRDEVVSNLKIAVNNYRENNQLKNNDVISPQCINGRMVIIINGVTYYAGTVDTWGDVKGGTCEE